MSLKTRIIPCLDVKDGRVVKGVQFVDLVDAGDPVEAAIAYDAAGADELCFLDITASHENRDTIFDVVARTAEHCFMPVTVGGEDWGPTLYSMFVMGWFMLATIPLGGIGLLILTLVFIVHLIVHNRRRPA